MRQSQGHARHRCGRQVHRHIGVGLETGAARLQDGALIVPLPEHKGVLQLALQGEALKGSGVLRGKTWEVSLLRTERHVRKE